VRKGQEINTCPYYGTRKSLQHGQLILVPYNSILHKNTRISLGIDLKESVLIIDEAHNLLEAIEGMHSFAITGRNLLHCNNQLSQYRKRYKRQQAIKLCFIKLYYKSNYYIPRLTLFLIIYFHLLIFELNLILRIM